MEKEHLEQIYALGFIAYKNQNYKKALEVFSRLVLEDPSDIRYLTSQAAAAYVLEEYSHASKVYLALSFIEENDLITPLYYACKCLFLSDNIDNALILFPFLKEKAKIDYTWNEKIRQLEECLHEYA